MNWKITIKKILAEIILAFGIFKYRLDTYFNNNKFCILMYHRITYFDKTIQSGMYVTPETFEQHIRFLLQHFEIISFEDLYQKCLKRNIVKNKKPICVITFDDGWQDFFIYAYPLLKKYKTPATVFLPTQFIGTNKQFWTDYFAYLICNKKKSKVDKCHDSEISMIVERIAKLHGPLDVKIEKGIEYLKRYPLSKIDKVLRWLTNNWEVNQIGSKRDFLNWSEICEMKDSGLISFGSHTDRHQILTTIDRNAVTAELIESRNKLIKKNAVGDSFIPFCYPNGNFTQEIVDIVKKTGYQLAVTTKKGWNSNNTDKHTLKRIGIHEDMASTNGLFASRIAGLI